MPTDPRRRRLIHRLVPAGLFYRPGSILIMKNYIFNILGFFFSGLVLALAGLAVPASPGSASSLLARQTRPDPGAGELRELLADLGRQRLQVIEIQRELVARPALNPEDGGDGEEAKARWIEKWLEDSDLPPAMRIDSPDQRVPAGVRPNLLIRYPGRSEKTLWLVAHLDTSPPGTLALWTGSPWALRVEGDRLYGRGVEDNHQAIVSGLILLESLSRAQVRPPLSLGLALTSSEKVGFPRRHGLEAVLRVQPDLFRPGDLIVVNDYGDSRGGIVEVSEKGLLWLKITVNGRQSHTARTDEGLNALAAGANLIMDLQGLSERFPLEDRLFTPPFTTFAVTRPESPDTPINQIPGEFAFHLDCRLLAPYTSEQIMAAVREAADEAEKRDQVRIRIERLYSIPAVPGTDPEAPVVAALSRAVRDQLGLEPVPVGVGGITLAADLRSLGLPVAVWAKADSLGQHSNENISITALLSAAQVFARMLYDEESAPAASAEP